MQTLVRFSPPSPELDLPPSRFMAIGHALVGLLRDGTVAHGPGLEPLDDGSYAGSTSSSGTGVHRVEGEFQQAPQGVGPGLVVHHGGVLPESAR